VPRAVRSPASFVLFGQLSGNVVLALPVEDLETLRNPTVQQPPVRRRHLSSTSCPPGRAITLIMTSRPLIRW